MGARAKGFGVDARERFVAGFSADGEDDGRLGGGETPVLGGAVVDFKDARVARGLPDGETELGREEGEEGETLWGGGSDFVHGDFCDSGWI